MVMMRLKKGSKVEVLSKREVPSGSWWPGEIVYGNGHTYVVKYDRTAVATDGQIVERVSRKFIRPCPPTMGGVRNWVAGDIAEVFDNHTWKNAVILKVVDGDYTVRFDGYPGQLRVHKSDLRVCLSWKNNQWEVFGKDSEIGDDRGAKELLSAQSCSKPSYKATKFQTGGKQLRGFDNQNGQAKRLQFCSSDAKTLARGVGQKRRRIEKDGRSQQLTAALPAPFPNQDLDYRLDLESSGDGYKYGCKRSIFRKKDMGSEFHKSELDAYRSTVEGLFASGPLSWEQEEMLTNLRLMLHISNDEHLCELRHLFSAES